MKTGYFKNTAIAAVAVATVATTATLFSTQTADAGRRDFWAGVGAGVVTGIVVNEIRHNRRHTRRVSAWEAHVDWCYDNRPRYRESDNTFRRNGQRRRECLSPYYN